MMLPARERFHPDNRIIGHRILRLKQNLDLPAVQRIAQIIM